MADIRLDSTDTLFSRSKVEAGLALALDLTGRYNLIASEYRDSVAREIMKVPGTQLSLKDLAGVCNASSAVFASCLRIGNLLRTEFNIIAGPTFTQQRYGIGFDIIRLRTENNGLLPDPAILRAMQRAACVAHNDHDLYSEAPQGLRARPTELVAVGGIHFVQPPAEQPWSLFSEKVTVSYDVVETIVHECSNDSTRTIVDVETRDAIYAQSGLYMVENYNPISENELGILARFEVQFFITGTLRRTDKGALLELQYSRLGPDATLIPLLKSSVPISTDSKVALRDAVRVAVRQLFTGS